MEEGLNLKKIVEKIQILIKYLLSKWKIIGVICLIGAVLGFYIGNSSITEYRAKSTFMINSSKGGGSKFSALIGMASSLGLGLGASSMNVENVSEIIISDRIVLNSLLKKQKVGDEVVKLGNYYIDKFGLREKWIEKDRPYKNYKFKGTNAYELSTEEYQISTLILERVKELLNVDYDKQSGIISISCKSKDQLFSYHLTNTLIDELTTFYVDRTTENERETFKILSSKTDSIKAVLQEAEGQLAQLKDNSYKTVKATGRLKEMQLEREIGILSVMYSTSVTNVEMARVNLLQKKPFIQVIDAPILPLKKLKKSFILYAILYGILFFFLITSFLIIRLEIKKALH